MEKYLDGEELSHEEIKAGIRKATIAGTMTPVLCGTSYRNKGVQPLLDAIVDYLPSPLDIPPVQGHQERTPTRRSSARPTTRSPSARWRSRSWPTRSSASWRSSASIPAP